MDMHSIKLEVNGVEVSRDVSASTSLRDFLRDDLDLTGAKASCQDGMCGNCTVLVNGQAVKSCLVLAAETGGDSVSTIEGLADGTRLHPLQQAFCDNFATQCGFCVPGMIMTAVELLEHNPDPSIDEVKQGLVGNLCRCTAYVAITEAVRDAAATMRESQDQHVNSSLEEAS